VANWQCAICDYQHPRPGRPESCPACGAARDVDENPVEDAVEVEATPSRRRSPRGESGGDNSIAYYYFQEIDRVPLLTAADEVTLAKQIECGLAAQRKLAKHQDLADDQRSTLRAEVAAGEQARTHMTEANSRLVVSIAKRYMGQGVPFLDLIQEGNLGLMQAVDRFDYRRGCKFSTYATWWIRQAVVRALAEQGRAVRLPAHANQQRRKLARTVQDLRQELGRDPTINEIADTTNTQPQRIRWAVETWRSPISLEELTFGDEDQDKWGDYLENPDEVSPAESVEQRHLEDEIREVMTALTPREERVLELRFGLKDGHAHKLVEVADRFGLTRERVRQIESRALLKLRDARRSSRLADYAV
jgi:RNA polymerase primary sigma factor